jgi:ankyrin repeat protein
MKQGGRKYINDFNFLSIACLQSNFEIIKLLIDNGAKTNILDRNNNTPLQNVLLNDSEQNNLELVNLLLENGSITTIDNVNKFRKNALLLATINQDFEIVKLLIENGANVNICNPIRYACIYNLFEIARILLENGADIDDFRDIEIYDYNIIELLIKNKKINLNNFFNIYTGDKNIILLYIFYNYDNKEEINNNELLKDFLEENEERITSILSNKNDQETEILHSYKERIKRLNPRSSKFNIFLKLNKSYRDLYLTRILSLLPNNLSFPKEYFF